MAAASVLRDHFRQNLQRRLEFLGRTKSLCRSLQDCFRSSLKPFFPFFLGPGFFRDFIHGLFSFFADFSIIGKREEYKIRSEKLSTGRDVNKIC